MALDLTEALLNGKAAIRFSLDRWLLQLVLRALIRGTLADSIFGNYEENWLTLVGDF